VKQLRVGALSASIFRNDVTRDGEVSTFHSVVISRGYKDSIDGSWKNSNSFTARDLPVLGRLIELTRDQLLLLDGADIVSDDLREILAGAKKSIRTSRKNGNGQEPAAEPVNGSMEGISRSSTRGVSESHTTMESRGDAAE
jgi:hypothetical protein